MVFDAPIRSDIDAVYFWAPIATLFGCNWLLGIWVQCFGKRDNSWIDVMWSVSFMLPNFTVLVIRMQNNLEMNMRIILAQALVTIWCLRLSIYIWIRHTREDYRYKEMREDWEKGGTCVYLTKAFGFVYTMQGFFSIINACSLYYINIFSAGTDKDLMVTDYIGAAVWIIGFLIEIIADKQLSNHLASPKPGTGKFIRSGVWRYSRHPNYFGEALMWWGIWIISCSLELGVVTVFSCMFITWSVRFLSGCPFGEKKYKDNLEW